MKEEYQIIDNLVAKLGRFTPDGEIAQMLSRALGKPVTVEQVKYSRRLQKIVKGRGQLKLSEISRIGLDLYDHRLDKTDKQ